MIVRSILMLIKTETSRFFRKNRLRFWLLVLIFPLAFCGCKSDEVRKESSYLVDICSPLESKSVKVLKSDEKVSMGGKEFCGSIILGDVSNSLEKCKIVFPVNKGVKNISFYLGSTHYNKAYYDACEKVTVFVDGKITVESTIYNHDLPKYYVVHVENAETVTFETEGENIISAIGELKVWETDVPPAQNDEVIDSEKNSLKLLYDIPPYYVWGEDNFKFAYSKDGQVVEFGGYEYTDALEVYLPSIEKWSNDYSVFFNLSGDYSALSFKAGMSLLDENNEEPSVDDFVALDVDDKENLVNKNPLATLCVYADGKLLMREEFSDFELKSFMLSVKETEKLSFCWISYPESPPLKMTLVGAYAER